MRASLYSAAVAATLAVTMWTPSDARAQVIVYPSISSSPYTSSLYYSGYSPASAWSYGWTTPYSTWNWSWYNSPYYSGYNYPYYTGYSTYGYVPRYWGGYRGWRRW